MGKKNADTSGARTEKEKRKAWLALVREESDHYVCYLFNPTEENRARFVEAKCKAAKAWWEYLGCMK